MGKFDDLSFVGFEFVNVKPAVGNTYCHSYFYVGTVGGGTLSGSSLISRRITIMSYPIVCFNIFLYIYFNVYDENVAYLDT